MSENQPLPLSIKPVISYPQQAQVGTTYMMTIDLETAGGEWLYEEEEYPIYCMLDTSPLFSYQTVGESAVVLHRFGGTYGAAKFLLTAAQEEMEGEIKVTLVNSWGVPIRVLNLENITVSLTGNTGKVVGSTERNRELNPYIIGSLIDDKNMFFGRQNIFSFIEDNLTQGVQVTALHGQRRIGKSSTLRQIPNFISRDNCVFVFFDLQTTSRLILGDLLHKLATKIINDLNLSEEYFNLNKEDFNQNSNIFSHIFIPQLYQVLGNKQLVLLLDEFNSLRYNNSRQINQGFDLFIYLKSLLEHQKNLFIIVVLENYPDDLNTLQSLFPSASDQNIGLLDDDEAKQLITQPAEGVLQYAEDAVQEILNLSAGHPYFTQHICFNIFNQARNENNWNVTVENVNAIVEQSIENAAGGLSWMYNILSIPERVMFSAIAEAQTIKNPFTLLAENGVDETEYLREAINKLADKGLLDDTQSRVKIELIRYWLLQSHPLQEEIGELQRVDAAANNLYTRASARRKDGNLQNAIPIYQEVLLINPNHFSALFDLAEIYLEIKQFNNAVELYTRAFKVNRGRNQEGFVQALFNYGNQLLKRRNLTLAREQFAKILEIDPDNTLAIEKLENITISNVNPFVVGEPVPPESFFGRKNEITTAFDQINNSGNLAIWGGPGMGKSSFLDKLASPEAWEQYFPQKSKSVIAVRLNCEVIYPFTTAGFWREVLTLLRDELASEPALQSEIDQLLKPEPTKRESLQQALKKLGEQNKFLLLLADNYDEALRVNEEYSEAQMDAFLKDCRYLANAAIERKYLSMVVSSVKRLSDSEYDPKQDPGASPWFNHYLFQPLKLFPQREVEQILKQNIPQITPQLQEAIREITGGHPYLLQIAGFLIYRQLSNSNPLDVQVFVDDFENTSGLLFHSMWNCCSEIEKSLLMLMALSAFKDRLNIKFSFDLSGIDLIFTQRERELTNLREQGVIIRQETTTSQYAFTSSIMARWVMQEIWNSDDPTLKGREKVFLNLMSRQQAKEVAIAMEWLWENKNQVPSILDWFAKRMFEKYFL